MNNIIAKNKPSVIDILLSLFLGLAFAASPSYYKTGYCDFNSEIILNGLGLFIIFVILTVFFRCIISVVNNRKVNKIGCLDKLFDKNKKIYKYRIIILASVIFICWLPVLGALYPGTAANDTWGQMLQFDRMKDGGRLNDHHPVLTTLVLGTLIVPLSKFTGEWHFFMFLYVIFQAIATSIAFSYSLVYAKEKLKLGNKYIVFFGILYCILPIFPCSVQAINKDALFSWIYVLFFINYIEIVRTNGASLKNEKALCKIIILSLLVCLTKKVGMYVALFSFGIMLFTKILNKKIICFLISIIFIFMNIVMPTIFEEFDVKKGGEQEKYSMLFQQTARYLKEHPKDVEDEEKEVIEEVIGKSVEEIVKVYNPIFADPVKGYSQKTENENFKKYIVVWIKQGIRHPRTYFKAANAMISGWISFREYKTLMDMDFHSQLNSKLVGDWVTKRDVTKQSAQFIQDTYDKIYNVPIIGFLLTPGLYIALIPAFALSTTINYAKKREERKHYWLVSVPLIASIILGCFLAPDSGNGEGQRYLYPVTYTSITMLMWVVYSMKDNEIEE